MQDFSNYNQQQPSNADSYYHDPLEEAKEPAKEAEPAKEEPPMLNQAPEEEVEPVHHDEEKQIDNKESNPELEEYLETTKRLLEKTRKERNNLIVRIDEEEDRLTSIQKQKEENSFGMVHDNAIYAMQTALRRKEDLIRALIEVVRSLK